MAPRAQAGGAARGLITRGGYVTARASRRDAGPDDCQSGAGHGRAGAGVLGTDPFLGLQSRQALVAQARARHRPLLLVPGSAVRAGVPDRPRGRRRRRDLQYPRCRRTDRLLRQWPGAAVDASAVAAGGVVLRVGRFHDVLAAPHVPRRRLLEIPRHPSFVRGRGLDFGSALSPGEPAAGDHRGRRRPADGGYFAQCDALARSLQYFPFGVRPRQSELDAWSVQIRRCDPGVPPLASHLAGRGPQYQFRRHLSGAGHPVRDLPGAGKPAARSLRCGRPIVVSDRDRRPIGLSVPEIGNLGGFTVAICTSFTNCRQFNFVGRRFRCVSLLPACNAPGYSMSFKSQRIRARACFGFLAIAILAWPAVSLAAADPDKISVNVDQAKLVKLPARVATIVVGNPMIADVALQSGGVVVVTGKGYGATNFIAIDRSGEVLVDRQIQVEGPTDQLVTIYRGVERGSYSCMPVCQRRVTLGDGETYFKSTIDQAGSLSSQASGAAAATATAGKATN